MAGINSFNNNMFLQFSGLGCSPPLNPWDSFCSNPFSNFDLSLFMLPQMPLGFDSSMNFNSNYQFNNDFGFNSFSTYKHQNYDDITKPKEQKERKHKDKYSVDFLPEAAVKRASGELGQVGGQKYGEKGKWCAAFASWAYGGHDAPWGDKHAVADIKDWAVKNGSYKQSKDTKEMKPGDLVVWRPETSNGKSHIGIISQVNPNGTFSTIEGNASNKVKTHTYSSSSNFDGFVSVKPPPKDIKA